MARGDAEVVGRQAQAVEALDADLGAVYRALGRVAVDLSERKGIADPQALVRIRRQLGAE